MRFRIINAWTLILSCLTESAAWNPQPKVQSSSNRFAEKADSVHSESTRGFFQSLLEFALDSPLWKYVLVPQARKKMVDTAASNGIPWIECKDWIVKSSNDWIFSEAKVELDTSHVPAYYHKAFHAYQDGNLCWEAAWEAEIASAAVGARNFPAFGRKGEAAFRRSFQVRLDELGAVVRQNDIMVDLGCGTGMSTRWLAHHYPQASLILGLDMSPYFVEVGKMLLDIRPSSIDENGPWINSITSDDRIQYQVAPDASVDVVNLQFVAHELPSNVTVAVFREAHRILKPNGQFWFCEMDFETPGYSAQRANPLLFSLIRATEPYLDDYAEHAEEFRSELQRLFTNTKIGAATGRHFAIVATKGAINEGHSLEDLRFDERGIYVMEDTHLKVWENKA